MHGRSVFGCFTGVISSRNRITKSSSQANTAMRYLVQASHCFKRALVEQAALGSRSYIDAAVMRYTRTRSNHCYVN